MVFFMSCSKDSLMGDQATDAALAKFSFTDHIKPVIKTVFQDPFPSYTQQNAELIESTGAAPLYMLGGIHDVNIGTSTSSLILQVAPVTLTLTADQLAAYSVDSLTLSLDHSSSYGYASSPMAFRVHQITQELISSDDYLTNAVPEFNPVPIASTQSQVFDFTDSVITDSVAAPPQLRIPLPTDFGDALVAQSLAGESAFLSEFKGLFLTLDTQLISIPQQGQVYSFDIFSVYSGITVYLSDDNGTEISLRYPIKSDGVNFQSFKHNYHPAVFNQINLDTSASTTYLTSMQGLIPVVSIDDLDVLNNDSIFIAKASLIVEQEASSEFPTLSVHNQLMIVEKDTNTTFGFRNILDASLGLSHTDGSYDISSNTYTFNITRYLQDKIQTGAPIEFYIHANRLGLYDPAITIFNNALSKPRLEVYYSKINH